MDFDRSRRHAFRSWLSVGVLVLLLAVLGVLQYRWIGEVSLAERERMHAGLEASLRRLSLDFNSEFTAACAALMPDAPQPAEQSRENLYAQRYVLWRESAHHEGIFRRIVLAYPRDRSVVFRNLDLQDGTFSDADLPPPWDEIRDRLSARMVNPMEGPRRPFGPTEDRGAIVEIPRFPMPPAGGPPRGPQRPEPRSRPWPWNSPRP